MSTKRVKRDNENYIVRNPPFFSNTFLFKYLQRPKRQSVSRSDTFLSRETNNELVTVILQPVR